MGPTSARQPGIAAPTQARPTTTRQPTTRVAPPGPCPANSTQNSAIVLFSIGECANEGPCATLRRTSTKII